MIEIQPIKNLVFMGFVLFLGAILILLLFSGKTKGQTVQKTQTNFFNLTNDLGEWATYPDFTTNIFGTSTAVSSQFRVGSPRNYFEQIQRSTISPYNETKFRTNETAPCCGGFAELWLMSDNTHSYAYIRAQRNFNVRSDDFFVANFKDNNKFRMDLNMDAIETHPLEDTSRFRVGNYIQQTNFIDLENVKNSLKLQAGKLIFNPTQPAPASSSDACTIGQFSFNVNFIFICTADGWKAAALSNLPEAKGSLRKVRSKK